MDAGQILLGGDTSQIEGMKFNPEAL